MVNDLISGAHSLFQCVYHIEWCPKYRFNVLEKESHKEDMEAILKKIAEEKDMQIEELAVMPDHVHVVVHVKPSISLAKATQFLKGKSSYEFFKMHPNMRKRYWEGHFWSKGKFYRSVGSVDLQTTKQYVQNQFDIHQTQLNAF
ncbi:MAG: IS200/IS605 family transposase [archaeon]|jgi:putative transposase